MSWLTGLLIYSFPERSLHCIGHKVDRILITELIGLCLLCTPHFSAVVCRAGSECSLSRSDGSLAPTVAGGPMAMDTFILNCICSIVFFFIILTGKIIAFIKSLILIFSTDHSVHHVHLV